MRPDSNLTVALYKLIICLLTYLDLVYSLADVVGTPGRWHVVVVCCRRDKQVFSEHVPGQKFTPKKCVVVT